MLAERRLWRHFDWPLLFAVVVLLALSVAVVYSATRADGGLSDYHYRQALFGAVGLVLVFLLARIDYRVFTSFSKFLYLMLLGLLVGVAMIGQAAGGAQRWIDLGIVLMQPSEVAKVLLVVALARYLGEREGHLDSIWTVVGAVLLTLPPVALIYLQPDLSTAVVLLVVSAVMIFMAGLRWLHLTLLAIGGIASTILMWDRLQGYMRERFLLFLDPASNPEAAYNINQALISIGAGGWLGAGLTHGTQNQLHFLRVQHTDFIFSVIAEELGFIGSVLILGIIVFILFRLVRIAELARDGFGRLLVYGVATIIFFQTAVNVAVNLNLMPVTGVPLPFISYGGSALLPVLIGIGLAESVAMRYRKLDFQ